MSILDPILPLLLLLLGLSQVGNPEAVKLPGYCCRPTSLLNLELDTKEYRERKCNPGFFIIYRQYLFCLLSVLFICSVLRPATSIFIVSMAWEYNLPTENYSQYNQMVNTWA